MNAVTFYPVLHAANVKVSVELTAEEDLHVDSLCERCIEKQASTGILDAVASVNWAEINTFDVERIVSIMHCLLRGMRER